MKQNSNRSMIKVTDKTIQNTIYFPKLQETEQLHIMLYGAGEEQYDLGTYADLGMYKNFYKVNIMLDEIPDGEYKYSINEYEYGLLIIGDLTRETMSPSDVDTYVQNEESKIEIISYE